MNKRSIFIAIGALLFSSVAIAKPYRKDPPSSKELQISILQPGAENAPCPREGQTVTVHYTGWLNDHGKPGKKFDSSVDRGSPFSFVLGRRQVIEGWEIGVKTMKVGEKRRLFIPDTLAYKNQRVGVIPPNADLIFDVELLNIR